MKKGLLLWLLLAIGMVHAFAQTRTIKGKVTDAQDGSPLPGVSVSVKGSKVGAVSGNDGTFSIQVDGAASLLFSFVGYEMQEEKIGNRQSINVSLASSNKVLNEVLVTGYGELKRKDVTSSVTAVSGTIINNRPATSFDQALTGRAAGVNISTGSGVLGDAVNIRIRGVNSISNSSQPLIIIDGIPMNTSANLNTFNSGNSTRYNPLADINPNDIETVDVLKDAAATALYGSRASAGVIVITTKRGKNGIVTVNYNGYVGWSKAGKLPKLLNGDDFTTIQNEKAKNATKTGAVAPIIAKDIDLNGDGKADRTNWLDEVFQTGVIQSHQLSLSGGTEKAKFYASGEYGDQKGIVLSNRLRRGGMRLNLDVTPKKWLKSGISLYASKAVNNGVLSDGYLAGSTSSSYAAMPNVPVYDKNGDYYLKSNGDLGEGNNDASGKLNRFFHPLSNLFLGKNDNTSTRVLSSAYVEVEPIPGLKLTSRFSVDFIQNLEEQYNSPLQAGNGKTYGGLAQNVLLRKNQWNWSNYATYTKSFNNVHFINAMVGVESQFGQQKIMANGQGNLADSYFKEIYDNLYAGTETSQTGGDNIANAFDSYFGKIGYNYGSKYYFDATLRADAYSDFGPNNRRGYFPGASVGWRISDENFFKDNISFISDMKVRASYGIVGNSNIRAYAYRTLYGGGSYADINGFSVYQIGDPNLKWETSKKLDIGLDMTLLKDRITVTADYFNSNINNLILDAPILATVGTPWDPITNNPGSILTTNVGSMWNKGVELTVNTRNIERKDFTWSSSFNVTFIKNRVTATADGSDVIKVNNRASVGKTLGVFRLIEWGGVNPETGYAMYYDKDHKLAMYNPSPDITDPTQRWTTPDGKTKVAPITAADAKYQDKSGYPTFYGGLNNTFTYKGIDFSIFLQYSGGNYVYNSTRAALMGNYFGNNLEEIKNRWTPENKNTDVPKMYLKDGVSTQASTRWLEKGDFLRAREISLGYTFPGIKKQLGVSTLRVYGLVQNAFIFTKYKGSDPEANTNRDSNINYGVDNRAVPMPRIFTLGLNVGF
ncbi:SusC/RagA family TonB-linked outer membrane protein [Chitinophaga sp. RAB17]|uniref:SusC/RagA family TonB-linked outer membrane protein n=1 Tax=Chitinophaga sp. RAB17 TaxID=3233049 RepID=UPI003F903BD7